MMTAARFRELKAGARILDHEKEDFASTLAWEKRSQASKRAVATKRAKYKAWPTRKNDHK